MNPSMNMPTMASPSGKVGNKIPSGYKFGQIQSFTPEQMQLFQQMFGHVSPGSYLSRLAGGEQSLFQEMEAPALRQFNEMQGNLASRFSGMGLGARNSSGFQNASSQASSNLVQDLQSRRQLLQQQAIKELMGLGSDLLGQRPYEQFMIPKNSFSSQFGSALGGAIPGAISGFFSGGPGGASGGGLAGGFGKYLGMGG